MQKQDVKRGETMVKKENVTTYNGMPSFLERAGSTYKLLEQIPDTVAALIVCSFIKTPRNLQTDSKLQNN